MNQHPFARHCERSEAIQQRAPDQGALLDCRVAARLAMTGEWIALD
jgi:hypothetical protein